ncbi:sensor domain-containing diguanylate cyclase [Desulfuromonas acetoxidans]|uniref:Periplasmic ligand-binding sensor protein n=1 Tax=Desulfuromonas acetoxidans (strain DSM 684 / 11070) TaxID=281689 RepID=Q1JWV5_DESA6|nr:diguanylate cyclase [Desulfuromonas acetoxidans]EAT14689.1 putative periplasmic ligand-binding sensor protein [Desulfuromonas acetoxidans DSM 684]MBF0646313.1 sensor domain-containing diguanylate cyclase [Desulfuromonas acetoxidans]NVD25122.1 sensor domain-containing diguanylate cyclase [Desulfuromonas acetoxidans]NVE17257.1 sensor domain-containing diguanylate cyclase [Desulfuromonas acetoxidans]
MTLSFSHRRLKYPVAILAFIVTLSVMEFFSYQYRQLHLTQQRNQVMAKASLLRAQIEYEIHTTLNLTMGLVVFVSSTPDFSPEDFNRVAGILHQQAPNIRNIALVKDLEVCQIYPTQGNEAALGLDYRNYPKQLSAIQRAFDAGKTVISGPIDLVQGGRGFISRVPIYTTPDNALWGLASIVIDADIFYQRCGLNNVDSTLTVALRGRDSLGATGDFFYGDPGVFDKDAVFQDIALPVGSWQMAMMPVEGWGQSAGVLLAFRLSGLVLAAVVAILSFALIKSYQRNRKLALHDPLTHLANRRFFNRYLEQSLAVARRNKHHLCLLYLDLNNFKPVNDTYGHKNGDQVLVTIAQRLGETLRQSDLISRIGGDEFVVILSNFTEGNGIDTVVEKLREALATPIDLGSAGSITLDTSIGISRFPDDGLTADQLLKHADIAMYDDKKRLKARVL